MTSGALFTVAMLNPGLLICLLDTLQLLSYTLYLQIEFPILVVEFLETLLLFDANFLYEIVPENKYKVSAPAGFEKNEVDALFFRNGG